MCMNHQAQPFYKQIKSRTTQLFALDFVYSFQVKLFLEWKKEHLKQGSKEELSIPLPRGGKILEETNRKHEKRGNAKMSPEESKGRMRDKESVKYWEERKRG